MSDDSMDDAARAAYLAYVAARAAQSRSPLPDAFRTYEELPDPERAVWRAVAQACASVAATEGAATVVHGPSRWPDNRFPGQVLVAISFDDLLAIDQVDGISAATWLGRVVAHGRFKVAVLARGPSALSAVRSWLQSRNFRGVLAFKREPASRHVLVETRSIDAAGFDLSEEELRLLAPWRLARAAAQHEDHLIAEGRCLANRDGDCAWSGCPQVQDGEPEATRRSGPRWLATRDEE